MHYRADCKTGAELSALGFGLMRLPRKGLSIDQQETEQLVLQAVEGGVNYLDTAYVYPGSEAALGAVFKKHPIRDRVNLATKLPHYQCKTFEDFDRLFAVQKERLHTESVDYYLIHNVGTPADWQRVVALGIDRWIAQKKASGEIARIGFSFHGTQPDFLALLDLYDWDFCQIQFNYMNETYQAGRAGLIRAHQKGLPVIIMEPLLGGKLATGLPAQAARLFEQADPARSPAAWGLQWLWNLPEVTVVLSGMNSEAQLTDNLHTAALSHVGVCTEAELAVVQSVRHVFEQSYRVPCTGCGYCLPCPQKVNIPGCFSAYNSAFAAGFATAMMQYMTGSNALSRSGNYLASGCVRCGVCVEKCPQHIDIPTQLTQVRKKLEPFWFGAMVAVARRVMRSE